MLIMDRILLTGASGFLGKHVSSRLKGKICKIYKNNEVFDGCRCDLNNKKSVKFLMDSFDPNIIIHCAADPKAKHPEDHEQFIQDHILSTTNLLEYCPNNVKFIYISSINVYGDSFPAELPTNLYGACKLSCEKICEAYSVLKDLKVFIIRSCAIVGRGMTHGLIYDIQRKLKSDSEFLELFGTEETCTRKPFVHVETVCNYIENAIDNQNKISVTIDDCFPGDFLSVKEVAEIIMGVMNIHKPIKWLGEGTIWKGDNRIIDTHGAWTGIESSRRAVEKAI